MNVLYYLDWFPRLSQSFVLNEIYYLEQQGHNVAVFALNEPEGDVQHEELTELDLDVAYADQPGVTTVPRHLLSSRVSGRWISAARNLPSIRQQIGTPYLAKQCLAFVDALPYEIDAVHSHFLTWNKLAAALVAGELGVQSSVTAHAYDLYASPNEQVLRTVAEVFDSIITISNYNEQYLRNEVDPDANIEVVRMGIRTEKFTPIETTSDPTFLTVARFVEKKGIEYALYALADVVEDYPNLKYRIIGSGPRRNRYDQIIERVGIEDNVIFLGSVSDEQLVREMGQATAFLLPCVVAKNGDRDGIPVSIMEAMAMETPPITTYVSGIPELVNDEVNGHLCLQRSSFGLSVAMRECITYPDETEIQGKNARKTIQSDHKIEIVGLDLITTFQQ